MSKQLQWDANATFQLSGAELEALINKLNQELNNPTAQVAIRDYELLKALQLKVQQGVESGLVRETEVPDTE